jgi:hypothetical protein
LDYESAWEFWIIYDIAFPSPTDLKNWIFSPITISFRYPLSISITFTYASHDGLARCHCEERSDEAISKRDCHASLTGGSQWQRHHLPKDEIATPTLGGLAMTKGGRLPHFPLESLVMAITQLSLRGAKRRSNLVFAMTEKVWEKVGDRVLENIPYQSCFA